MDGTTRAFVGALLADNERLERQAVLALGVAQLLQELAARAGADYGVRPIGPDLTLAGLQELAAALTAQTAPREPHDGRVAAWP